MALSAGVPIVPIRITCDRATRLRRWDSFCLPLPSATIVARCGAPIRVSEVTFAEAEAELVEALGRE